MPSLPGYLSPTDAPADGVRPVPVTRIAGDTRTTHTDQLAVEEPLEIRLGFGPPADRQRKSVSVTMRTPGHDVELAVGFLFTEGIVRTPADVLAVETSRTGANILRVDLHPDSRVELNRLERHFYTASSCGVCGKTSLDAVEAVCDPPAAGLPIAASVVHSLPAKLRDAQPAFARTGGLHAAALFDSVGNLLLVREDVGRHNAADKLIGRAFLDHQIPLIGRLLFVSGRASFELVQKAAAAGIGTFAAVGAPSSLAVELADRFGMTLIGFVRDGRFNVYTGADRVRGN